MNPIHIHLPIQASNTTHQSGTRINSRRTYKTAALTGWENTLYRELKRFVPDKPIEGPIRLETEFFYKASRKKDRNKWKVTKPDTDNLVKTLKDVMTRMGFWIDDAQVVDEHISKRWAEAGSIYLRIEPFEEQKEEETCTDSRSKTE